MNLVTDKTYLYSYNPMNIEAKKNKTNNSNTLDDENKDAKEKENKTTVIKIKDDNFYYIYSVDESGKRTLIKKLPIPLSEKNFNNEKSKTMITTNPRLNNLAVINNCKAALKFNQEILKGKRSNNDINDMMKILLSM